MIPGPRITIEQVAAITGGRWLSRAEQCNVAGFSTDSRLLRPGELFIALHGKQFDGNDYAVEAQSRGACGVVISRISEGWTTLSGNVIRVDDSVAALQALAGAYRQLFPIKALGITGSTGKTIVKDMLTGIMARRCSVLSTPLSFHGQIGLPLTLFGLRPDHELLVLEMGISRPAEMVKLARIAGLQCALITNISETHLEHLGSIETVASEKMRIFDGFNTGEHLALLNADDILCRRIGSELSCPRVTFGLEQEADFRASRIETAGSKGAWFDLHYPGGKMRMYVNAPGKHNIYNALAAICAAHSLGADFESIRTGLEQFHLPQMRLEIHTSSVLEENVTIINDTYNASPASMRGALDALRQMAGRQRTIAILGDMLELGNFSVTAHEMIGQEVQGHGIDLLLTIGKQAAHIARRAIELGMSPEAVFHCQDTVEAAELLHSQIKEGDFLLFKGSRLLQLDLLAAQFIGGIRPTKLIIDLGAISHNVRIIKERVGPAVKIMAVVKSGGYGHDSRKVADVVVKNGADYLAVAVPDEGIFLRKAGFDRIPILVMGPTLEQEAIKLVKYGLAQAVDSPGIVTSLEHEARKKGVRQPIHLKVDTGMGRIGLLPDEVEAFVDFIQSCKNVFIEGIMTHLSSADDRNADDFTRQQLALFNVIIDRLEAKGLKIPLKHAAASSGILFFPESWFTMVRPGILLYGLCPQDGIQTQFDFKPAASFVTKIAHIKTVPAHTPISYNRTFVTEHESRIATLPVGYYDGYNRLLSNKGRVLIRGHSAPIVGRITMDMTMVDVTHIPEARTGDEVVLFGSQHNQEITLAELAHQCGTIHYELIGNISARVSRVYCEE
ncbi:alanine racemase [bacterium]|nr:alanine racemase [bacterium]